MHFQTLQYSWIVPEQLIFQGRIPQNSCQSRCALPTEIVSTVSHPLHHPSTMRHKSEASQHVTSHHSTWQSRTGSTDWRPFRYFVTVGRPLLGLVGGIKRLASLRTLVYGPWIYLSDNTGQHGWGVTWRRRQYSSSWNSTCRIPLIWTDVGSGILPNRQYRITTVYETTFVF